MTPDAPEIPIRIRGVWLFKGGADLGLEVIGIAAFIVRIGQEQAGRLAGRRGEMPQPLHHLLSLPIGVSIDLSRASRRCLLGV